MFSDRPTILYLTSKKASYFDGQNKGDLDWDGRDFDALFKSFKTKVANTNIRIILGDDLSYVLALAVSENAKPQEITAKANELVPEEISVSNSVVSSRGQNEKGEYVFQVFAIAKQTLDKISESSLSNNINIEYICPILSLLAGSLPEKKEATLFLWFGTEKIAFVAKDGIVYGSEDISSDNQKKIAELTDFIKDRFDINPKLVYTNDDRESPLNGTNPQIKRIALDLFVLALSHSVTENDQNDLMTIKISHQKSETVQSNKPTAQKIGLEVEKAESAIQTSTNNKKSTSPILLILISLGIIAAVGYLGYYIYQAFFR